MIKTTDIYTWIPRPRNSRVSLLVNGTEEKSRTLTSSFRKPCTIGIGDFKVTLSNPSGIKSTVYSAGQTVKFYADQSNPAGTTLQFWGIIDYIKEKLDNGKQYLELEGRHRAYMATETLVCYSAIDVECGTLLKALITQFLAGYGFTSTNVSTSTGKTMTVNWNYKPFWECVLEICKYSGYDCYVDDDLDVHLFAENSIANENEGVIQGDTFLKMSDWGTDTYYEKTRVVAVGKMSDGVTPIVYTAISAGEGTVKKEVKVEDTSANTYAQVKSLAEAELSKLEVTGIPQAKVLSFGLETVKPGDNIWYVIKTNKIMGQYKLLEITHKFGANEGGWKTETSIEKEIKGTEQNLKDRSRKENQLQQVTNVNKLDFCYPFEFNDSTNLATLTGAIVEGGWLKKSSATSYVVTSIYTAPATITKAELRYVGIDMGQSQIRISCDGGNTWTTLTKDTLTSVSADKQGISVVIDITFTSDANNVNPAMDSMNVLLGIT